MAPVSRTSRRPVSTPAVTARWVHILNGNNRSSKTGQDPRKAVDPHIGSAAKLFCRPGPTRQAPATTENEKRGGMAPMQWPYASTEALAMIEPYVDENTEQDM